MLFDGESTSVRYIGVDTPESGWPEPEPECFSEEATDLNRELVEGRRVRLVVGEERFDPYDRLLAYVYAGRRMVNAELIRAGAAETLTIPPNDRFADRFSDLEGRARADNRGLWGACR
ncbi:MAG: thermonuclease family protein [Solirubrobacterales bacterium]